MPILYANVTTKVSVVIANEHSNHTTTLDFQNIRDYNVFRVICKMFANAPEYDKGNQYKITLIKTLQAALAHAVKIDYGLAADGRPRTKLGLREAKAIVEGALLFDKIGE